MVNMPCVPYIFKHPMLNSPVKVAIGPTRNARLRSQHRVQVMFLWVHIDFVVFPCVGLAGHTCALSKNPNGTWHRLAILRMGHCQVLLTWRPGRAGPMKSKPNWFIWMESHHLWVWYDVTGMQFHSTEEIILRIMKHKNVWGPGDMPCTQHLPH